MKQRRNIKKQRKGKHFTKDKVALKTDNKQDN